MRMYVCMYVCMYVYVFRRWVSGFAVVDLPSEGGFLPQTYARSRYLEGTRCQRHGGGVRG